MKQHVVIFGALAVVLISFVVFFLITTSMDPNRTVSYGKHGKISILMAASLEGDIDRVRNLLQDGADVNAVDEVGYTSLHHALNAREYGVTIELLVHGADPNIIPTNLNCALSTVVRLGQNDLFKIMLEKGADPLLCDDEVIGRAVRLHNWKIVEILLCDIDDGSLVEVVGSVKKNLIQNNSVDEFQIYVETASHCLQNILNRNDWVFSP